MTASVWDPESKVVTQVNANGLLKTETQAAALAQTDFTLQTFAYAVGTGSLLVFKNGKILTRNKDYLEIDNDSVQLKVTVAAGDEIQFVGVVGISGSTTVDEVLRGDILANTGSGIMGWIQKGIGAVAHWVLDKLRERVSVFDFMTDEEIEDVTSRTFSLNVAPSIQKAMDYAAPKGIAIKVPAGLYRLDPLTEIADEDTSYITLAALIWRAGTHFEAELGAVFKIADNISTDAAPQSMCMFGTSEVIENGGIIRGLEMDMNGANNPISPDRPATYNRYNQSHFLVSGTNAGVAARVSNLLIDKNRFINNPGVCCIVTAQSNVAGVTLGKNVVISNNTFYNNGLDSDDHTAIFAWGDNYLTFGNTFENPNRFHQTGSTGGNTAYEVHGNNHKFIGNRVKNYYRGMWVSSNLTDTECRDTVIANNDFVTDFYGVDFFRTHATLGKPQNTLIIGNTFRFDSYTYSGSVPQQKCAINIASAYAISDVLVTGNVVESTDSEVGTVFATITPQNVASQKHNNIVLKGNKAKGVITGVVIRSNATTGLGNIKVSDNEFFDPIASPTFLTGIGVFVDPVSPIDTLVIQGNSSIDTSFGNGNYGTYIQGGTITDLVYKDNFAKGQNLIAEYLESGVVTGNKHGTFENISFIPTLKGGDVDYVLGNGNAAGRYSILGKLVMFDFEYTIGSTTTVQAGNLSVTIPVAAGFSGQTFLGSWRIFDTDATKFYMDVLGVDGTASTASFQRDNTTFVTHLLPAPLAEGDKIVGQVIYRRA